MIKRDDYQLAAIIVGMFLLFIIIIAFICHDTYYRKPESIKCIDSCNSLLSIEDERIDVLEVKERCAEKCMDMEASKQPIIYKAECTCKTGCDWITPYYDIIEWGNYTFNYSLNDNPNWVYVNNGVKQNASR